MSVKIFVGKKNSRQKNSSQAKKFVIFCRLFFFRYMNSFPNRLLQIASIVTIVIGLAHLENQTDN